MTRLREYHRPETIAEALALLARPGVTSTPLAGGTTLVPRLVRVDSQVEAVVDLSRLGLDFIELLEGRTLGLGATATLAQVAENALCRSVAGGLLSRVARMNAPVNVRNVATVGGVVAEGDTTSELLLALLALDAEVIIESNADKSRSLPLEAFLSAPADALAGGLSSALRQGSGQGLLREVRLAVPQGNVGAGFARVARTPHDRPIVAAAAVLIRGGDVATWVGLTMSGVAGTMLRLSGIGDKLVGQPLTDGLLERALSSLGNRLTPPDDFRGSAEYRRAVASILARRALREAWATAVD
ncbi:MAG: FAD binding domain-containing protein [Anaerolineae bacterium]|nr:MAG: FAD binding domain-containing protein [Anaerolineae bacterium]